MVRIRTLTADASFKEKREDTFAAVGRTLYIRTGRQWNSELSSDKGEWHEGRTRGRWRGAACGRGVARRAGGVWHVTDAHRGRVVLTPAGGG